MSTPDRIAAVCRFNRFYAARIGAPREGLHQSPFSFTEARVMHELAKRETTAETTTAGAIARALDIDPGYLSRILARFLSHRLVAATRSVDDARRQFLRLTEAGRTALAPVDTAARAKAHALLAPLPDPAQAALVGAMARIETLLGPMPPAPTVLRPPRPGDIGWVIARHGALYAQEYGFDARFEALVGKVATGFLATHDPAREACWIAARDGENLGSVFLVSAGDAVAQLRLLLVEPAARGEGLGGLLVATCIDFARARGYRRITLWTNDVLVAARHVYQAVGFRRIASKPHADFGPPMLGEDWVLDLRP